MKLFTVSNYKAFLRGYIEQEKRSGLITELAAAAGCNRTYLSQVLAGKAQLTPDQAVGLAEFFGFDGDEEDYFLLLVLHDRASSPKSRKRFREKMAMILEQRTALSESIRTKEAPLELSDRHKQAYYSSWMYGAIHILTSVPRFQTTEQLSAALKISPEVVSGCLSELVEMGLCERVGGRYRYKGGNVHVPSNSPLTRVNHASWRMKAATGLMEESSVHYTSAFTVEEKDAIALKVQLLQFIDGQRKVIQGSGSEMGLVFCCDLFSLTGKIG